MTRTSSHLAAAVVALALTVLTFQAAITVPGDRFEPFAAASLA